MRRALVLGATSAIASEVAIRWAARGDRLHLVGRNADKLDALVRRCAGGAVSSARADFTDLDGNRGVVEDAIGALGQIDCALIAHGDLGDQLASERDFTQANAILCANLTSVVSLLIPLANHLEAARAGRLAVITSVAGDRGRPRNYTYGAAKGALNIYLQGLRTRLRPSGVWVTTLKLGPIDTPMTIDHRKHALFGKPGPIAADIVQAIDAGRAEVYLPSIWRLIMPIVRGTPEALFGKLPFLSGR